MGNKAGYAEVILAALGLRSGHGAGAYLWAEADDDVAALLRCYPDASMLRRVAEIIRGWADEEPRALWERLRAERKARGPRYDAEGAAGWMWTHAVSVHSKGPHAGLDIQKAAGSPATEKFGTILAMPPIVADRCHRLAEYATIVSGNRLVNMAGPDLMNTGNGGTRHGGEFATAVGDVAAAFERAAGEVSSFEVSSSWSYEQGNTRTGFVGPGDRRQDTTATATATATARLAVGGWPPVLVLPRIPEAADVAEWMGTPGDLEDCIVYMDPPYAGTTGYAATLSRDQVVRHARAYAELGAVVAISEAEVVIPEWDEVEITGGRRGQKRTFSRQQAEWLTMNREPAHRVAVQAGLFAVGA
jgi:hypothetical protein